MRAARHPRRPRSLTIALLAGGLWGVTPALGQAAGDEPVDATPAGESAREAEIREAERFLPRVRPESAPVPATRDPESRVPQPGLTGGHAWPDAGDSGAIPAPTHLPEGASIVKRPGRVVIAPTGHRIFVVDPEARTPGEGAMLLLPCRALARMEASVSGAGEPRVIVSGIVHEYGGRNYLLLTAFNPAGYAEWSRGTQEDREVRTRAQARSGMGASVADASDGGAVPAGAIPDDPPGEARNGAPDAPSLDDDPLVAELMEELERTGGVRALAPPTLEDNAGAGAESASLEPTFVADGTPMTRRRARLVRLGGGEWALRFDNDLDPTMTASSPDDTPMTVLPCKLLERMEKLAMRDGDALELLVSGRVYTYGSRRYVLPTIYQRPLKIGIDPIQ